MELTERHFRLVRGREQRLKALPYPLALSSEAYSTVNSCSVKPPISSCRSIKWISKIQSRGRPF